MKATRKLITIAIVSALFSTQSNFAQAAAFSFDQAYWKDSRSLLVYRGRGVPGSVVETFLANTSDSLGSTVVDRRGNWRLYSRRPNVIPCDVRAESGSSSDERSVSNAPATCVSADTGGGDTPPENTAPVISGSPSTQVAEGQAYSFRPSASDADGDSLTFSIDNRPAWASFNSATGLLSGTPGLADAGTTSNIRISVSDGTDSASLSAFSITVTNTNQAPTISGSPATSVAEGANYQFAPTARDADGDALTYSIVNRPSWASFNTSTGVLSGTPGMSQAGTTSDIRISVSDGSATASLNAFSITVTNTNQAPTISGSPTTHLDEGVAYRFTPSASDPDGDALTFSVSNLPSWANFNTSTGAITGTPDSNSAGTYSNIVIRVSDGSAQASLSAFAITVADVAETGGTFQFARNAYTVEEGGTATLTVTRSNSNGAATVNYGTYGVEAVNRVDYNGYAWTPLNFLDGETSKTIRLVTLTDTIAEGNETLEVHLDAPSTGYTLNSPNVSTVTIQDAEVPNTAPVISGSPSQNVVAGTPYSFTPNASDADNDTLTFSVANLPSWASFNTNTGTLSGVPSDNDTGTYGNIVISVSDGSETASLSPLSLTVEAVQQATTGSVSLAWVAPSTRTDGSSLDLSEIHGYRIYMGTTSSNLEPVLDLDDGNADSTVMDNLETGTYYFAITAYDDAGSESDLSNIARKEAM
ncbi:MAG: putative Ig domain-containing protein [Candidatus Thiodiazotropha sp.]